MVPVITTFSENLLPHLDFERCPHSVYMSVCLSVCLSVYLCICVSVCLSVYLCVCLFSLHEKVSANNVRFGCAIEGSTEALGGGEGGGVRMSLRSFALRLNELIS